MPEPRPGLHHVGIHVPHLDVAIDFLVDEFGARLEFRIDDIADPTGAAPARLGALPDAQFSLAMLEIGAGRVELLAWRSARNGGEAPAPDAPGGSHFAITVADLEATLESLRRREDVTVLGERVVFDSGPTRGLSNAFVRTSWGLLVELLHWPPIPGQLA